MGERDFEVCEFCGRKADDVAFDYLGPDHNDPIAGEKWGYSCGPDEGCSVGVQAGQG